MTQDRLFWLDESTVGIHQLVMRDPMDGNDETEHEIPSFGLILSESDTAPQEKISVLLPSVRATLSLVGGLLEVVLTPESVNKVSQTIIELLLEDNGAKTALQLNYEAHQAAQAKKEEN